MRTLTRNNEIGMKYSLNLGTEDVYEVDEETGEIKYIEIDGELKPVLTGEKETRYSDVVDFDAPFSMSGGEAEATEFGVSLSDYTATITYIKGTLPLTETSLVWRESKVGYFDAEKTKVNPKTADYSVVKISDSLNFTKALLRRMVK